MDLRLKGEFNMIVKYTKGDLTEILQQKSKKELERASKCKKNQTREHNKKRFGSYNKGLEGD
jgi:hypothetical protein